MSITHRIYLYLLIFFGSRFSLSYDLNYTQYKSVDSPQLCAKYEKVAFILASMVLDVGKMMVSVVEKELDAAYK